MQPRYGAHHAHMLACGISAFASMRALRTIDRVRAMNLCAGSIAGVRMWCPRATTSTSVSSWDWGILQSMDTSKKGLFLFLIALLFCCASLFWRSRVISSVLARLSNMHEACAMSTSMHRTSHDAARIFRTNLSVVGMTWSPERSLGPLLLSQCTTFLILPRIFLIFCCFEKL